MAQIVLDLDVDDHSLAKIECLFEENDVLWPALAQRLRDRPAVLEDMIVNDE